MEEAGRHIVKGNRKRIIILFFGLMVAFTTSCSSVPDVQEESTKEESWKGYETKEVGDFEVRISKDRVAISKYLGTSKEVEIPSQIEGMPVTRIWGIAFSDNLKLEKVIVPEGVTKIGEVAFGSCENLKEVYLPASLMKVGRGAFWNCSSLERIEIAKKNPYLKFKNRALYSKDLKTIYFLVPEEGQTYFKIPNGVEKINEGAFWGCDELVDIILPESIVDIGEEAFDGCESLEEISIPMTVIHIGAGAFHDCYAIKTFNLPKENPQYMIEDGVIFSKDKTLLHTSLSINTKNSYRIPDSVKKIEAYAFSNCNTLKSIVINEGVEEIGEGAFEECRLLKSISIPPKVTEIKEDTFAGCWSLEAVDIPDGVVSIGMWAFARCESLEYIMIPDSVVEIGKWAFGSYSEELVLGVGKDSEALHFAIENNIKTEIR